MKKLMIILVLFMMAACTPAVPSTPEAPTEAPVVPAAPAAANPTEAAPTVATDTARAKPETSVQQSLTVMTHDSFSVSEGVIAAFEKENNVKVNFLKAGDTGAALNRAILSKQTPLADVFYGVDTTFLSRALDEDIFEPYASPAIATIPEAFRTDPSNRATPVDYGDVCINFDKAYFAEKGLKIPASLEDLTLPEYKGLLAVENPATSSPGLAFLLATIAHFGPENYLDYWRDLKANGVVVVSDWEAAYYSSFSASSGKGPQPMVVSYASSPAVEVVYAASPIQDSPTDSLVEKDMCFRQIEFVGILKGTQNRVMAEKFVDFMLSVPFQEDIPLQMFVYPVNPEAKLPEVFQKYSRTVNEPATLDPKLITENREAWIEAWTAEVLK